MYTAVDVTAIQVPTRTRALAHLRCTSPYRGLVPARGRVFWELRARLRFLGIARVKTAARGLARSRPHSKPPARVCASGYVRVRAEQQCPCPRSRRACSCRAYQRGNARRACPCLPRGVVCPTCVSPLCHVWYRSLLAALVGHAVRSPLACVTAPVLHVVCATACAKLSHGARATTCVLRHARACRIPHGTVGMWGSSNVGMWACGHVWACSNYQACGLKHQAMGLRNATPTKARPKSRELCGAFLHR